MPTNKFKTLTQGFKIVAESSAAILIDFGDREVWVPRSQIESGDRVSVGDDSGDLSVTSWMIELKGLPVD